MLLCIVYWFYYRWSPHTHIYVYTCDFKFCSISRHVSEIIEHDLNWHTFTYLLHKVCGVMLGKFSSGKYYLDINLYETAPKKFLVKNIFFVIYLLSIKIKIRRVDYYLYYFFKKKNKWLFSTLTRKVDFQFFHEWNVWKNMHIILFFTFFTWFWPKCFGEKSRFSQLRKIKLLISLTSAEIQGRK